MESAHPHQPAPATGVEAAQPGAADASSPSTDYFSSRAHSIPASSPFPMPSPGPSMSDVTLDVGSPPVSLWALTRWQGALQGALVPGRWLPGLRTPHCWEESWRAAHSPNVCLLAAIRAAKQLRTSCKCQLKTMSEWSDEAAAVLYFYTDGLSWLDVLSISLTPLDGSCLVTLRSCSSGLLPVSLPGAPLLNMLLCWFPFYDMDQNRAWISALKQRFDLEITLMRQYRPC